MQPAHVESVAALEARIAVVPWTLEMLAQERTCGSFQRVLLAENGQLTGYVIARPLFDEWHVMTLGVAPEFQRRGLGRRLVQGVIDEAVCTKSRGVLLEVRHSNHPARTLYHRLGFASIAIRRGYYHHPVLGAEDAVVMARWIGGESSPECAACLPKS